MEKKSLRTIQQFSPNGFVRVFCWEGEGIIVVGDQHAPFTAGETVIVPKNTPHGYLNTSQDRRMMITVVQCPLPVEHVSVEPGDLKVVLNTHGVGP